MVEIFFGIIIKQAIRRESLHSVDELETTMRAFIQSQNRRAEPFRLVKTADHVPGKIKRKRIIETRHKRRCAARSRTGGGRATRLGSGGGSRARAGV